MFTTLRYALAIVCFAATDPLILIVAVVTALIDMLSADARMLESQVATLFSGQLLNVLIFGTLFIGVPAAFRLPNMRMGRMGWQWQVPSTTYLLPRLAVRIMLGAMLGQSAACLITALRYDPRLYWLFSLSVLLTMAFCVGGWLRFRRHPALEFNIPVWRSFISPWRGMLPTRLGGG